MIYILGVCEILGAYAFEIRIRSLIMESMATLMTLVVEGMWLHYPKGVYLLARRPFHITSCRTLD